MLTLKAKPRKILGRKVKKLREENIIPAVIYGHKIKSKPIQVKYQTFKKILEEAGESSLVNLEIEGEKTIPVLIRDLSYHPLSSRIEHVDFYQIKAGEKVTAEVELKFIGESLAVKNLGGVLITPLEKIEIECLPQDLIHEIGVDVSLLNTFEDEIKIKDLKVPEKIKVLEDREALVASVEEPREEEELVKPEAAEEKPEEAAEEKPGEEKKGEEEKKEGAETKKEASETGKSKKDIKKRKE